MSKIPQEVKTTGGRLESWCNTPPEKSELERVCIFGAETKRRIEREITLLVLTLFLACIHLIPECRPQVLLPLECVYRSTYRRYGFRPRVVRVEKYAATRTARSCHLRRFQVNLLSRLYVPHLGSTGGGGVYS